MYPDGYLKKARDLCDELDILLIVDEVATGFGRTGTMFVVSKRVYVRILWEWLKELLEVFAAGSNNNHRRGLSGFFRSI